MASRSLTGVPWPASTQVKAYPRRFRTPLDTAAPPGAAVLSTANVTSAGSVTFDGLAVEDDYWAVGQDGAGRWRWVAFATQQTIDTKITREPYRFRRSEAVEKLATTLQSGTRYQDAENSNVQAMELVPATLGGAPFQIQSNSFPNLGDGAGTYNHGAWLGWNAGRFAKGPYQTGKAGLYMGFEDNYFDYPPGGDQSFGVEWYVGYTSPDGTTVKPADYRPFYFRILESDQNIVDREAIVSIDIGSGTSGSFNVMGSVLTQDQLFVVHRSLGIFNRLPSYFTATAASAGGAGSLQVAPTDGYAQIDLVAPGTGTGGHFGLLAFKDFDTYRWTLAGSTGSFQIQDSTNAGRLHVELTPGSSDTAAVTTLKSNLAVKGKFGVNGATPQPRVTITSPTADVTSLKNKVDEVITALYQVGICA